MNCFTSSSATYLNAEVFALIAVDDDVASDDNDEFTDAVFVVFYSHRR